MSSFLAKCPMPNHLRGPFQVQQGKVRENLQVNPVLNETITYLGQSQKCDAVHFSALMEICALLKHIKKRTRDSRGPLH